MYIQCIHKVNMYTGEKGFSFNFVIQRDLTLNAYQIHHEQMYIYLCYVKLPTFEWEVMHMLQFNKPKLGTLKDPPTPPLSSICDSIILLIMLQSFA